MQAVSNSYSVQAYTQIQNNKRIASEKSNTGFPVSSPSPSNENDPVSISSEGTQISHGKSTAEASQENAAATDPGKKNSAFQPLTEEELNRVMELKRRDTEVRAHEQAHLAAAGQYATSSASFSYSTGPDGKRYATGGEVSIDMSSEKSPEATAQKMRTVRRAALAPASPSSTDRNVAAQAAAKEAQALQKIREESSVTSTGRMEAGADSLDNDATQNPKTSEQEPAAATISDFSRRRMKAAYQHMSVFSS